MNNKIVKICFFAFILLCCIQSYAQVPGDENEEGNLETPDPKVPINEHLILLSVAGIALAFYGILRQRNESYH